jgi:hypothetical protein
MTCPRCFAVFETGSAACPDCGVQLLRNVSGMLKTSAVMISADGEQGFYRSVQDVPEPLREQLLRVTSSENSGTIVIADRAGKDQLTQIVARRESVQGRASTGAGVTLPPMSGSFGARLAGVSWVVWAGAALLLGSAAVVTAVFTIHW